jgi:hypothetical protein
MLRSLSFALALALPVAALAGSVYLNGINIDGVVNQVFDNARVEIDANGNVRITAKGYAAKSDAATAAAPTPPVGGPTTKKYWLVTEKAAPGMSQYDIDLFINAKWVRKFLDDEQQITFELTKHLVAGPNKVQLIAKKTLDGVARRSSSPNHYFRIVIGEAEAGGRNIMMTKKLIDYKRTAFETQDFTNDFTIQGQ